MYTVEPLIKDTLTKAYLCLRLTRPHSNHDHFFVPNSVEVAEVIGTCNKLTIRAI